MPWPQKNSYGWGRVAAQNNSNLQCLDTRRTVRASKSRRKRCWIRSHKVREDEIPIFHHKGKKGIRNSDKSKQKNHKRIFPAKIARCYCQITCPNHSEIWYSFSCECSPEIYRKDVSMCELHHKQSYDQLNVLIEESLSKN